ncbi:MAG: hypothetical protein II992_01790 [Lachnospiraceae bacterium]|nr:hypothetical protein [Lachnospiraceae bacterium]
MKRILYFLKEEYRMNRNQRDVSVWGELTSFCYVENSTIRLRFYTI